MTTLDLECPDCSSRRLDDLGETDPATVAALFPWRDDARAHEVHRLQCENGHVFECDLGYMASRGEEAGRP